jgi:gliding motility-associated lipoprotein GldH
MTRGINSSVFIYLIILLLANTGCNNNIVYSDSTTFPSEIWKLDKVAEFSPAITDTLTGQNIYFIIRTGSAYPFRNIWLFVNTLSPSGKSITDTLQYMLADEKGKWYGRGPGDVRELNLPFRASVFFPEKGIYKFNIRHGMRIGDLKGVYDLGLRIEKAKK